MALVNRLLPRASFARSVGVLAGGTAIAQVIGVMALPILTRLYSPADFSILAVYASILGIIAGVACLRLEIAIPIPERDEDAVNLLAIAMIASAASSVVVLLFVWFFPDQIVNALGQKGLQPFLWMIPLGIWLASSYSAVQFWATRKKRFNAIASTRVAQSIGGTVTQLVGGLSSVFGPLGLLLGHLINNGFGVIGLGRTAWAEDRKNFCSVSWGDMRRVFRMHSHFPKYSTFEVLANNGAVQLPVIIIAAVAIGPEAGYLFLAMKAMAIPIGLIGSAVAQVYLSRASDEMRQGQLGPFTLKTIAGLMKTGVGPLVFAGIVSPVAFPMIFGSDWQRAGEMVAWMTPWFVMQFISSPVSMVLHVTNNQRAALQLQIAGFVLRVGGVILATIYISGNVFEVYAGTGLVFYTIYLMVVMRFAQIEGKELFLAFVSSSRLWFSWMIGGICIVGIVNYFIS